MEKEEKRIVEIIKINGKTLIRAKCKYCGEDYIGTALEFCTRKCVRKYQLKDRKWGNGLTKCVKCGRSDRPHWAHGLCTYCRRKQKTYKRAERQYFQRHKNELEEKRKPYKDKLFNGGYRSEILENGCEICRAKTDLIVFHLDRKSYTNRKKYGEINNSRENQVALCKKDLARVNFGFISL